MQPDGNPRVSVIVPVRNAARTLDRCLQSVLTQDVRAELIVADDGSTDGSVERFRVASDTPVRIVDADCRTPGGARNRGVTGASGELLVFLDADCEARPGWLGALVGAARARPELAAIGGPVVARPDAGSVGRYSERLFDQARAARRERTPYLITANLLVRRPWFEAVGGFDWKLPRGEDVDFSYRLTAHGARLGYEDGAVVEHANPDSLWELFHKGIQHGTGVGCLDDLHPTLRGERPLDRLMSMARYRRIARGLARAVDPRPATGSEARREGLYDAVFESGRQLGVVAYLMGLTGRGG